MPPSLLATALLLQSHDKMSDAEAKARADFDYPVEDACPRPRSGVALGIEVEPHIVPSPRARTAGVQCAQLDPLHGKVREVFESKPAFGLGSRGI